MFKVSVARGFRASNAFTIFVVCVSIFTEILLLNIVVPILPYILKERLDLDLDGVQRWNSILLAAHGFAMIIGSLSFGWVDDQVRNQRVLFTSSLALLAGATLCFYLGSSVFMLLLARLLQGLSGAAVFTFGRSLILQKVGHARLGRAMGWTGTAMSGGLLIGPVAGGWLFEIGGSALVFLLPIAMLIAEILLRLLILDGKRVETWRVEESNAEQHVQPEQTPADHHDNNEDEQRAKLCSESPHIVDERDLEALPLLERELPTKRHPFVTLLLSPRILATLLTSLIFNTLANGFDAILPAYCLSEFHARSSQVAVFFLLMAVPMLFSPVAGHLTDRYGTRWPMAGGLTFLIPSIFCLRFVWKGVPHPFLLLGMLLILVGSGFALAMPPLQVEISAAVEAIETRTPGRLGSKGAYGQAYGLLNTSFSIGAMMGPLVTGFLRLLLGWQWTSLVMASMACIAALLVVTILGGAADCRAEDSNK